MPNVRRWAPWPGDRPPPFTPFSPFPLAFTFTLTFHPLTRLTRKLLRDLYALKTQALAVALVMSCGLAMMITTRSLILSLETARDHYSRDYRFAQVFARLKRAPQSVRDELAALPGVGVVQTGISLQVTLDLPGLDRPALGLVNSLPEYGELELNRLHLRRGRMLVGPAERGEVLVSEAFADRTYQPDGSLTPRGSAYALITDEAEAVGQVLRIVQDGLVRATDGSELPIAADTVCLHGDGAQALAFAWRLRAELATAGIAVTPFTRAC